MQITTEERDMKKFILLLPILLNLFFLSCATAGVSESRMAYITSREHGWIELSVQDSTIPPRPPKEKETDYVPSPPFCYFTVKLNKEEFIREEVYPFGDQPPYKLDTGFRFPVPVGEFRIDVIYTGCKEVENDENAIEYTVYANIAKDFVIPIKFDGEFLSVGTPFKNTVITLKDIDNRLKRVEQILQSE
jgi:hypothetical protein